MSKHTQYITMAHCIATVDQYLQFVKGKKEHSYSWVYIIFTKKKPLCAAENCAGDILILLQNALETLGR